MRQRWPSKLWVVRHGQSAGNVARDLADAAGAAMIAIDHRDMDVPLSELGEAQARSLGHWFAAMPERERPEVVLASPYVRAVRTAELIGAGGKVRVDERLREREFGVLDRLTTLGIHERFPEQAEHRGILGKFYHRPPGGESWCDVILRLRSALDTKGLWSVARGLARNEAEYKSHLMACDAPRHGDRDGRGTLSEAALADFTRFFLQTCIDQVTFMEGLMKPDRLRDRIMIWAEEEMRAGALLAKSDTVLRSVLLQGELARADVVALLGVNERSARRVTSALIDSGALTSTSTRAPLHLAFPAKLAGRWMPGLFPDA